MLYPGFEIDVEAESLTKEQKRQVVEGFTKVTSDATGISEGAFYVFAKENDGDNVAVGGTLLSDR